MPAHTFASLLKEIGEKIGISNLESTQNNNITLTLKGKNDVVLQQHKTEPYLIISFEITEIPAGRYRENILREGMKFNGLNQAHEGIFGFSKKAQKLFLFDMLPMNEISADQVNSIMHSLSERVTLWKDTTSRGDIPNIGTTVQSQFGGGIFGMRP